MNAPQKLPARKMAADLPFWKRPIGFGSTAPKLKPQARATMIRQLATLAAVMPISDAVATLARQPGKGPEKDALMATHRAVQAGVPLAAALPAASFPAEIKATIAAGEASGRLPLLLNRLADSLEAQAALRSRLLAALAYPALLILVAIGVIVAMLVFVVPSIAEQLSDSGQPLPFLTRAVLAVSGFLQNWGLLIVAVLVAILAGFAIALRREPVRARLDAWLLRLPGIGGWLSALEAVRWSRLLSTMTSAGLPLAEALHLTAPTLGNAEWRTATEKIAAQVRAGSSLSAALALLPNPPGLLVALTQSGEASGRLAPLLDSAANTLDRQLTDRSRTALALAEPLIIVVLGALVGLIILSVLLPILQLNTAAGSGLGGTA